MIPLTAEVLFSLYGSYNQAIAPLTFFGVLLCLAGLCFAAWPSAAGGRSLSAMLGAFWLWNGAVFQLGYLATLTWAAWIFAGFFILAGLMFLWAGAIRNRLGFRLGVDLRSLAGVLLLGFALAYPLLDRLAGWRWPQWQLAGTLPAPTVLATFAFLLMARTRSALPLAIIPLLWAMLHGAAALFLGLWQDVAMAIACAGAFVLLLVTRGVRNEKPADNYGQA